MNRYRITIAVVLLLGIIICPGLASAEIDWWIDQTIKLDEKPLDTAMSVSGTYLFALTDDGIVHAYDSDGNIKGEIYVGKNVDHIDCGPEENILILNSKKNREIQKIVFEFIEAINTEGSPFKGNADAPIVIAVFTDYQCPYCARLWSLLEKVLNNNKDTVRIVSKNYPLPMHGYARYAAAAALAAFKMGKFREFDEALFRNAHELSDDKLLEIATGLGLDPDEFEKEMKSQEIQRKIEKDMMEAEKVGITGTPTVFINGRKLRNRTLDGFQDIINSLLNKQ